MLLEDEMNSGDNFKLSDEHIRMVEEERANYLKGVGKSYSWEEAKEHIRSRPKIAQMQSIQKGLKKENAMLEVDAEADWWDTMPDDVKASIDQALEQSARGEVIPHEDVKAKYPQWFTK